MKYVQIPKPVQLLTIADEPITNGGEPVVVTLHQFALARLADPAFVGEKKGTDAAFLVWEAKQEIDAQKSKLPGDFLALENATFSALKRATETPSGDYDARFRHCLIPFFRAIADAKSTPPAAETTEECVAEEAAE